MNFLSSLTIPDFMPSLVGILVLLVIWQYHQKQVLAGRIQAVDIFDRSGIRMFIYAAPDSVRICEACRMASGTVYLPSQVAKNESIQLQTQCARAEKCTTVLVPLYGSWLEARGVVERLKANRKKGHIALSPEELRCVINGQWERSISAVTDRLGVHMLEGLAYETINPELAICSYRYVIDQAQEIRHLLLLVPAYMGLIELLAKQGRPEEALQVIEQYESRFPQNQRGRHYPTEQQRRWVSTKKSYLTGKTAAADRSVGLDSGSAGRKTQNSNRRSAAA